MYDISFIGGKLGGASAANEIVYMPTSNAKRIRFMGTNILASGTDPKNGFTIGAVSDWMIANCMGGDFIYGSNAVLTNFIETTANADNYLVDGNQALVTGEFFKQFAYTTESTKRVLGINNDDVKGRTGINNVVTSRAETANFTVSIPAGYAIDGRVFVRNTTANAVTGGIKIGTTDGGTEVLGATAVGASAFITAAPTLFIFSATAATTLFVQAVTAWNSASIDLTIPLVKALP
jgi:hypothetical protein